MNCKCGICTYVSEEYVCRVLTDPNKLAGWSINLVSPVLTAAVIYVKLLIRQYSSGTCATNANKRLRLTLITLSIVHCAIIEENRNK